MTGAQTYYYHQDHLGSSTVMTDANGVAQETTAYLPYGSIRTHAGQTVSNYKFTGQELDPETGLYYFNARYYDSAISRFISPDPMVSDFANPQSLNRYSYCLNNPLIYIDPSGYWHVEGGEVLEGVGLLGITGLLIAGTIVSSPSIGGVALIGSAAAWTGSLGVSKIIIGFCGEKAKIPSLTQVEYLIFKNIISLLLNKSKDETRNDIDKNDDGKPNDSFNEKTSDIGNNNDSAKNINETTEQFSDTDDVKQTTDYIVLPQELGEQELAGFDLQLGW